MKRSKTVLFLYPGSGGAATEMGDQTYSWPRHSSSPKRKSTRCLYPEKTLDTVFTGLERAVTGG
jgi:hypothetical protein